MKIRIEVVGDIPEDEVTIRCGRVDDTIQKIHQFIIDETQSAKKITFFKQNQEFYFPLKMCCFLRRRANTFTRTRQRTPTVSMFLLYELEELLPKDFARASKSTIVNVRQVYSITVTSPLQALSSLRTHKQVYLSRYYYNELRQRLNPGTSKTLPAPRKLLNGKQKTNQLTHSERDIMKHSNWFWGLFFVLPPLLSLSAK